jgi:hypothetical protein
VRQWVITYFSLNGASRESAILFRVVCSAGMATMIVFFKRLVGGMIQRDYVDSVLRPPTAEQLRRHALRTLDELR